MSRRSVAAIVSLALLLAAVAIWLIPSSRAERLFVLPQDGTRLSFYKATSGTKQLEAIYANDWRDRFARFVPARYASKLGFKRIFWASPSSSTNDLVVVLKRSGQSPGPTQSNRVITLPRLRVTVVDEHGLEADYSALDSGGGAFVAWGFANYPRRSRTIHLRFWDASKPSMSGALLPLLADMEIPNPAPSSAPPWVAETLPAARVTNGLEISLLKLETGLTAADLQLHVANFRAGGAATPTPTDSKEYSLAEVAFRENGQPATGWRMREIRAVAPTGVSPSLQYVSDRTVAGVDVSCLFGVLWPEEPAWEVTLVVDRPVILPEDVWSITNIPMPRIGDSQSNAVTIETNMSGIHLVFLGVSPAPSPSPGPAPGARPHLPVPSGTTPPVASPSTPPGAWMLRVAMENYSSEVHLMLGLQTDTGPAMQQSGPVTSTSTPREGGARTTTYSYDFLFPAGATKLDANIIVTRSRTVTFRVKPTLVR